MQNGKTVNRALVALEGTRLARLAGRRKRFLMDVEGADGPFTAHTNNTGAMLGLLRPGSPVLLSVSGNPGRKHACTVEAVGLDGFWVGVNTGVPLRVLRAGWEAGILPELAGCGSFRAEPRFEGGRLDACLDGPSGQVFVETKNVTMVEDCAAQFPDAPSERARKHLVELARLARSGVRAALFFAVQRPDARCFRPADAVDPEYAKLFYEALACGVEAWPYVVDVAEDGYRLGARLPVAAA